LAKEILANNCRSSAILRSVLKLAEHVKAVRHAVYT